MLQTIEDLATFSVARGCGFAGLGIFTFMIGMMSEPQLALATGGILTLVTALVLFARAAQAIQRPFKRTEVWIMLKPAERPRQDIAQQIIGNALRDAYLRFALQSAWLSAALLTASLIARLMPV